MINQYFIPKKRLEDYRQLTAMKVLKFPMFYFIWVLQWLQDMITSQQKYA